MKAKQVTRSKIARDIVQAFNNDSKLLPGIAGRVAPDDTAIKPNADEFVGIVTNGNYNDDISYHVLYNAYWYTTSITSALMCSPDVLGQSYLPDAQLKRMAKLIYDNYTTVLKINRRVKTNTP